MNDKKLKQFIKDFEHYCPTCPESERDDTYVAVSDLKMFVHNEKTKRDKEKKAKKDRSHTILNAGYAWINDRLPDPESVMLRWSFTDWQVVTERHSPVIKNITVDEVTRVRKLLGQVPK